MFFKRILISCFEFSMSILMLSGGIYLNYKAFIKANPDFDMEQEIKKNNVAVGILVAAIMLASSMIMKEALFSLVSLFRIFITAPESERLSQWRLPVMGAGHLVMAFTLAVFTISIVLRVFGRMMTAFKGGDELKRGNVAVGMLLASVVLVAGLYVSEGVSSLSKALIPQQTIGRVQILK